MLESVGARGCAVESSPGRSKQASKDDDGCSNPRSGRWMAPLAGVDEVRERCRMDEGRRPREGVAPDQQGDVEKMKRRGAIE